MKPKDEDFYIMSFTLDRALAKDLKDFSYKHDLARSAVIEYALLRLLDGKDDASLTRLAKKIEASGFDRVSRRHRYAKAS
jgi:hypothetical protein